MITLFSTTEAGARVTFNDARRFGAMDLAPTEALEEHWLLAGIGPEPLANVPRAIFDRRASRAAKRP
jgi:formamidopyrimidine-DNA glycosylase